MAKIVFGGAFGIRSQGDDASIVVLSRLLHKSIGEFDGVVLSRHPQDNMYGNYGLRSIANIEYPAKAESIGKWFRGFNPSDDRTDLRQLESEIGGSDLLVLGAGNAFIDQTIDILRGPIPYITLLTLMARMSGVPVMLYGISVGPLNTPYGRKLSRLCSELADAVTLRDARSIAQLREIGYAGDCDLLPDPVMGLDPPSLNTACHLVPWQVAHRDNAAVAAIAVRALPPGTMNHEEWIRAMACLCDYMVEKHNLRIIFIPQCTYARGNLMEDDRNVAREVVKAMKHGNAAIAVEDDLTVDECLSLYSNARIALCTRLHGAVFSAISGVPTIAFNYNPKVYSFMEWLGQPGQVLEINQYDAQLWHRMVDNTLAAAQKLSKAALLRVAAGRLEVQKYSQIALGCLNPKSPQSLLLSEIEA